MGAGVFKGFAIGVVFTLAAFGAVAYAIIANGMIPAAAQHIPQTGRSPDARRRQ
jgi:hypothetical protein